MRFLSIFSSFFIFALLFSCVTGSTGSSIVTGIIRPATSPTEVNIYLEPPMQYEIIGLVEASSKVESSTQATLNRVINELKIQAAKIGANGVLLINVGSKLSGSDFLTAEILGYNIISETRTAQGKALYVIQK